jgi:putative tricarboxylic transport membrane protein
MIRSTRLWVAAVAALLVVGACGGGGAAEYPAEDLSIMAPADPGGGWDSTARAIASALTDGGLIETNVEVYNVGGAGGTVGLAQFVSDTKGDPYEMMVMGLVMVGAIQTNQAPVDLTQVTPLARLTNEWEAIVVPAGSPYQTLDDLIADFVADPTSVSWGGGSAGGTDHQLVALIAQAAGVEPGGVNYVAHSGGGEAMSAILSGAVSAGVSGVSEFADQVAAGELRWLAVSSDAPISGVEAPTISDSGLDVVISNWRGIVGPPELTEEEAAAVVALLDRLHDSDAWKQALETNGWSDYYLSGDAYAQFLESERKRVDTVLREVGLVS